MTPFDTKNVLFCGVPKPEVELDHLRKEGKTITFIVPVADKMKLTLRCGDQVLGYESDEQLRGAFFQKMYEWRGAQILDNGDENDMGMTHRVATLMAEICNLHNFDQKSAKVLTEDNQPLRNTLTNYRWVQDGLPLSNAKDKGKNGVAIIVAAGPSLDSQWKYIKEIREGVPLSCIFTVGRSYKKAMEQGASPDVVVECEQFEWNSALWNFAMPPVAKSVILACPATVCPGILSAWPGEKMILMDHELAKLMKKRIGMDSLDGGNSVAHIAFNLAAYMGFPTIVLAGVDLGYPDGFKGLTHADGTFHAWPAEILRIENSHQEPLMVEAFDGEPVQSSAAYMNFKNYFEIQISKARKDNPNLKVYSASKRGQKIGGVEPIDLGKWKDSAAFSSALGSGQLEVRLSPSASSAASGSIPTSPSSTSDPSTKPSLKDEPALTKTT